MIYHYFKIAFRNHSKHKIQSAISLLSLAIAFASVSLAAFWTHYEQTYDSFLPGYDRIYKVANMRSGEIYPDDASRLPLVTYLMENYPEVDKAWGVRRQWQDDNLVEINNEIFPSGCIGITLEAADALNIKWLEGNVKMGSWKENEVAVSEQIARKICGKESPVGMALSLKKKDGVGTHSEYQIAAVFQARPNHSNFKFNILKKLAPSDSLWGKTISETYVQLHSKTDSESFLQKAMVDNTIKQYGYIGPFNVLTPLKEVHYTYPEKKQNIRLDDVKLFAGAAILLSICALVNYLTLFVSRLRTRGRNMALRAICGSTSWQIGMLLMIEYFLLLLGALLFGMVLIELVYSNFVELVQLEIDRLTIYVGCGYLLLFILVLATALSLVPIFYFKRKTLRVQMESIPLQLGKSRFRIVGVSVQLFVSMLFIFCATVMIKQVHYLVHDDINIERKNIASLMVSKMNTDQIMNILRQFPMITETVPASTPLFPCTARSTSELSRFEGREDLVIRAICLNINSDIARFYGLKMKDGGDDNFDLKIRECLINETLAKQLGYSNPVGKTFHKGQFVIKGVVYDFPYQPPTEPVRAVVFYPDGPINTVAFKYSGDFAICKAAIEKAFEGDLFYLNDGETVYKGYLRSEFNLLKLLNIITVISLLIALFGVYALILQECERQRKSIAVRKVFGAQVKDILMMFFKEYMLQVVIAAALAFPIGYVLMKRWLEGYSRQTTIGVEVFLGIFLGMAILVLLCIGWHVWRAANENPATAVKKE